MSRIFDVHFAMAPAGAFRPLGGRMRLFKKDSPPAPDYSQLAAASREATAVAKDLGERQLTANQQQFDATMQVAQPVIAQQLQLMKQAKEQGDDYYQYAKGTRGLEDALRAQAATAGSEGAQEAAAGRAVADVRQGTTAAQDRFVRSGKRVGLSPVAMAARGGAASAQLGLAEATAANAGRTQEENKGIALKSGAIELSRGGAGNALTSYGLANASGAGAVGARSGIGSQLVSGMAGGTGTIMQGQGLGLQGLQAVAGGQQSMWNAKTQANAMEAAGWGQAIGQAGSMAMMKSDRRLKAEIVKVDEDPRGFGIYEFVYRGGDGTRYRGVMADEVESIIPDAVHRDDTGFASVDYSKLGFDMVEV